MVYFIIVYLSQAFREVIFEKLMNRKLMFSMPMMIMQVLLVVLFLFSSFSKSSIARLNVNNPLALTGTFLAPRKFILPLKSEPVNTKAFCVMKA